MKFSNLNTIDFINLATIIRFSIKKNIPQATAKDIEKTMTTVHIYLKNYNIHKDDFEI
jgi:hypothetical protein